MPQQVGEQLELHVAQLQPLPGPGHLAGILVEDDVREAQRAAAALGGVDLAAAQERPHAREQLFERKGFH